MEDQGATVALKVSFSWTHCSTLTPVCYPQILKAIFVSWVDSWWIYSKSPNTPPGTMDLLKGAHISPSHPMSNAERYIKGISVFPYPCCWVPLRCRCDRVRSTTLVPDTTNSLWAIMDLWSLQYPPTGLISIARFPDQNQFLRQRTCWPSFCGFDSTCCNGGQK